LQKIHQHAPPSMAQIFAVRPLCAFQFRLAAIYLFEVVLVELGTGDMIETPSSGCAIGRSGGRPVSSAKIFLPVRSGGLLGGLRCCSLLGGGPSLQIWCVVTPGRGCRDRHDTTAHSAFGLGRCPLFVAALEGGPTRVRLFHGGYWLF